MGVTITHMLMTTRVAGLITAIGPDLHGRDVRLRVHERPRLHAAQLARHRARGTAARRSACCCANMRAATPTGCGSTNASSAFENVSARFARALGRTPEELDGTSLARPARARRRALDQSVRRADRRGAGGDRPARGLLRAAAPGRGRRRRCRRSSCRRARASASRAASPAIKASAPTSPRRAGPPTASPTWPTTTRSPGCPTACSCSKASEAALAAAKRRGQRCAMHPGRPRPLQGDQRHARPRRRRPSAGAGRALPRDASSPTR